MVKILVIPLCVWLAGCSLFDTKIVTKTIEVSVPLLYCPAPPTITRPPLPIHLMTPKQQADSGEVVKHYKATVIVLIDHTKNQQIALDEYNHISTSYEELRGRIEKIDNKQNTQ